MTQYLPHDNFNIVDPHRSLISHHSLLRQHHKHDSKTPSQSSTPLHYLKSDLETEIKEESLMASQLYQYLKKSNDLGSLQNNPDHLLSTIALFHDAQNYYDGKDTSYIDQFKWMANIFQSTTPDSILHIGTERDFGYSLLCLSNFFHKKSPNFKINSLINTTHLSEGQIQLIQYLVNLSGLSEINLIFTSNVADTLSSFTEEGQHFDWIIINHMSPIADLEYLRMLESIGIIQPRSVIFKTGDYSKNSDLKDYLLGAPSFRRQFNSVNSTWYTGRWNLIYKSMNDKDEKDNTLDNVLYVKCTDHLDS